MATALTLKRLFHGGLVIVLLSACAAPPDKALDFETVAEREIAAVVRFAPPRFALAKAPDAGFVFHEDGRPQITRCERSLLLGLVVDGTRSGSITAGVCANGKRLQELVASEREKAAAMLEWLTKSGALKADRAELERALTYRKSAGSDGSEIHYLPVILAGAGLAAMPTVVMLGRDRSQAVVVQAQTEPACGTKELQTTLCSDPAAALREIAQRLHARFGGRS